MRTITVKLSSSLAERIDITVRRTGTTTSALVREALENRLRSDREESSGTCLDLCRDLAGSLTGPTDLSSTPSRMKRYGR
jgi:Arc/MetJ-type ribon-helix-helix transcriptional regulator